MTTPDLTRRQRDVLRVLRFRASLGDCWLVVAGGYLDLWVPTMMKDRHLERLWTLSPSTPGALIERGLATTSRPQPFPLGGVGRRFLLCDAA